MNNDYESSLLLSIKRYDNNDKVTILDNNNYRIRNIISRILIFVAILVSILLILTNSNKINNNILN